MRNEVCTGNTKLTPEVIDRSIARGDVLQRKFDISRKERTVEVNRFFQYNMVIITITLTAYLHNG